MNRFLKFLYRRYTSVFHDFLIEEFYGMIPDDLKAPSIDFLCNGKDKLERFFSIQAYNFQRRSIMDSSLKAEEYKGVLIHIKSLLAVLAAGKPKPTQMPKPKKVIDPLKGIQSFIRGGKDRIEKAKKETVV